MAPGLFLLRSSCAFCFVRDFPHIAIQVPELPGETIAELICPSKVLGDLFDGYTTHGREMNGFVHVAVRTGAEQAAAGRAKEGEVASLPIQGAEAFFSLFKKQRIGGKGESSE